MNTSLVVGGIAGTAAALLAQQGHRLNAGVLVGLVAAGATRLATNPSFEARANTSQQIRRAALSTLVGPYQQGLFVGDADLGAVPWSFLTTAIETVGGAAAAGISAAGSSSAARQQAALLAQQAEIEAARARAAEAGASGSTQRTLIMVGGGLAGVLALGGLGLLGYRMMKR